MAVSNGIQVIGMHRLSVLFHHIVRDIHQIVDRADAHGSQPSLHPFRRRPDLDILDHSRAVARAEIRILNCHLYIVIYILVISCGCHHRGLEFLAECGSCLSCDSDHAEAVHAVGCNLILEDHVVQTERFDRALSHDRVLRENVDAILRSLRIHFSVRSQFFDGAHHAAALHPAEFPFLDLHAAFNLLSRLVSSRDASSVQNDRNLVSFLYVRSACHDLDRLCPDVHLADDQFVRVRMLLDLVDLTDHDLVKIRVHSLISLNLCPGQRHCVCVFLRGHVKIRNICFYP